MATITNNVMAMQNELRNKEGITGIDAMHHVLMVLLAKSFTIEQCQKLNIPEEFAFENMIQLNKTDLYNKFYNPRNSQNCIVRYIRQGDMFGYTKDLPFQIKNESTLEYMFHKMNHISTDELMNTYDVVGDIYEHFINREGKTMKDLGQYFTDRLLINYLVNECNPQLNDNGSVPTVWDPASGTGGFLIEYIRKLSENNPDINWSLNKNNLFANDINKNTYSLLKQNLYYSLREGSGITIKLLDSLVNNDEQMYDFILANPPFGIKGLKYKDMNDQIKELGINGTKGEILFLQLCMCKLNENGKCAIVVPEGVLFNSTKMYKETRKHLLENFNLKKVIKIGEGEFFKNTGVKTSVLFFEKTGQTENVEFIQVNKVNDSIEEVPLMTVEMEKIVENDYSLNMNLYKEIVLDVNEDFEVVELGNLFTLEKGKIQSSKSIPGNYKLMSQSNKRTHNEYKYDGENLFISCVNPIGTIYYYNGRCNCSTLLYTLIPKNNTNVKYLYYYLKRNENMFKCCETGSANKSLSIDIFNKIKIPVPPLEVQNRIVEQLDNIYETEIESSKNLIDSLKMSIETIMKNTMYRDDLQEYKINDVCEFKSGKRITKKEHTGTMYPVYGGGNISFYTDEPNNRDGFNILLSVFGSSGKITLVNGPIFLHDNGCSVNSTNKKLNNTYLGNYLHSFNEHIYSYKRQTGVPTLDIDSFKNYKIRIPPIEVQKEILEKVEPKESLIQELEKNIERAEQEAKDIMQVLFN